MTFDETHLSHSEKETEDIGAALCRRLYAGDVRRAFITLGGEMGAGKTAFTRGFAGELGVRGVRSPTFTVVNEYGGGAWPVFHFDLYRVQDADELYAIGFDDYLARDGYALCEWSENAGEELPAERLSVHIDRTAGGDDERRITIKGDIS